MLGMACALWACGGDDTATTPDSEAGGTSQAGGTGGSSAGKSPGGGGSGGSGSAQGGKAQGGTGGTLAGGGTGGLGQGGQALAGSAGASAGGETSAGGVGGQGQAGSDVGTAGTDTGTAGTAGTGTAGTGTGTAGTGPTDPPKEDVEMTFTTANIGRKYANKAEVQGVFNKIEGVLDGKTGPRFIGWQEIGEADPCGDDCEIDALQTAFKASANWNTFRPKGKRPDDGMELVKVPITSKGGGADPKVRAVFASPGWAGVSPTRFVTVVYFPDRNVSVVNTHFIAGAWSCESNVDKRRDYWKKAWAVYKSEIADEHSKGRHVIATGDLNRARATSNCNPDWDPTSVHPDAKDIAGTGIDYVFAIPAQGAKFVIAKNGSGEKKEGTIALGIDGHSAHWVTGTFTSP